MTAPSILIKLVEAVSLLTLGAMLLAMLDDRVPQGWVRQVAVGLCLAVSALTSMADPLVLRPGYLLDARGAAIILAGPFGGPLSVIIVAGLCAALRLAMGGGGVPIGLFGIGLTALASLGWWWHLARRARRIHFADLHAIALMGALLLGPVAGAVQSLGGSFTPSIRGAVAIAAVNFLGAELLGILLLWMRERRRAIEAVASSEAQLRAIAHNLPGAIYERRLSPDGALSFRFLSEGVRDVMGVSAEQALADPATLLRAIAPEDRARFDAALKTSANDLTSFTFQGDVIRPDGKRIAIRSHATPRRGADGEIVWNGLMLDVTEQVRLAQEAEAARRAADRAVETQARFLAYVTHEFRSPLGAILGYSELAATSPVLTSAAGETRSLDQARLAGYIETIHVAADHLSAMTEDLLDFGKMEAGRLTLAPCWLDLAPVVDRTVALLQPQAEQRKVALDKAVRPDQRIYADPRRLQQILLNLLTNAVKYSTAGGRVTIQARTECDRDILEVADTGIGMNTEQVALAFDAYGQVDNTTNRMVAGTGLGLPLVKQLVDLHGGTIVLTSEEGQGTRVIVTLLRPPALLGDLRVTAAA